MAELADTWCGDGKKNVFGNIVKVTQMESECGAAGALHGAATSGALATTFTASQGLLLMIPDLFKIAGEQLPVVFHVAARSVSMVSSCIFGDHSDVMATRQCGQAMLNSQTVQEVMDLAAVAHLSALRASLPFMHFFDGFQVSHEVSNIEVIPYEVLKGLVGTEKMVQNRQRAMNPTHPQHRNPLTGRDLHFQQQEAPNKYYVDCPDIVQQAMDDVAKVTGRQYHLFDYYGDQEAEDVIVMMGAGTQAVREYIGAKISDKVGLVAVHLFRPFSARHLLGALPKTCKRIAVLDRTKEPGSIGEPLYLDVCAAVYPERPGVRIFGGRYGLGDKAFTPAMVHAVYQNLRAAPAEAKPRFTVGIHDDVTHLSLPIGEPIDTVPRGTTQCIFWGMGSDGTVGANKNAIKLIGNETQMYAQGYFFFTAHKSGGVTTSHLRFGRSPITSTYPIEKADYVACHQPNYIKKFSMTKQLRDGGTFVLNCLWSKDQLERELPASVKRDLAAKKAQFYIIDAYKVAREAGLGGFINGVMQSVFFKLSGVIEVDRAIALLKDSMVRAYKKKGEAVIKKNQDAIGMALGNLVKVAVPAEWASAADPPSDARALPPFVRDVKNPIDAMLGNELPVSKFSANGATPNGTTRYEKRHIAVRVPVWDSGKCVQCAVCASLCPASALRLFALTAVERDKAPESMAVAKFNGKEGYGLRVQVSPDDCTGCGACVSGCPAKEKALSMAPVADVTAQERKHWDYCVDEVTAKPDLVSLATLKGTELQQPLLEFPGACAGCGEMAYLKMLTQLFGERMVIANASGCSSAVALSYGAAPYCLNRESGWGPAFANSLFEENAEFGFGINQGHLLLREKLRKSVAGVLAEQGVPASGELRAALEEWVRVFDDGTASLAVAKRLSPLLEAEKDKCAALRDLNDQKDVLSKFSTWIVGGDGWAYDINFQGLDHVLTLGADVNIIVLDTEVYSNTGGQKSKATPMGAVHKFASAGKSTNKKDLGLIAMLYENVYVAQICMNANPQHALRCIREAEAYPGTSLVLCYCPCIEHGIEGGDWVKECKSAVSSGYWPLYHYNPLLAGEGKQPFSLDSAVSGAPGDLLEHENRFMRLLREKPQFKELHPRMEAFLERRFAKYRNLGRVFGGSDSK